MILKIRIISDEVETFFMNIEIDESDTFSSLHNLIQKECNFKNEHISSFFISNDDWEKGHEITLLDMGDESPNTSVMSETSLHEHITSIDDKLIYIFDQFNDRGLFITVIDISEEQEDVDYPVCSHKTGNPPELTEDDIISLLQDSEDIFDDISGESSESDYFDSDTEDLY
ncbi:MAG: IS1096 element passenger TnpR family protein [Bacteroidota bacterium]